MLLGSFENNGVNVRGIYEWKKRNVIIFYESITRIKLKRNKVQITS